MASCCQWWCSLVGGMGLLGMVGGENGKLSMAEENEAIWRFWETRENETDRRAECVGHQFSKTRISSRPSWLVDLLNFSSQPNIRLINGKYSVTYSLYGWTIVARVFYLYPFFFFPLLGWRFWSKDHEMANLFNLFRHWPPIQNLNLRFTTTAKVNSLAKQIKSGEKGGSSLLSA